MNFALRSTPQPEPSSLFPTEGNMQPACAFSDAADREFVWETLRMDVVDPARQESALQALDGIFERLDNSVVLEWDGDRDSTSFLFVEKGEAEDCQVTLTMSEWMDRGSPLAITVFFGATS